MLELEVLDEELLKLEVLDEELLELDVLDEEPSEPDAFSSLPLDSIIVRTRGVAVISAITTLTICLTQNFVRGLTSFCPLPRRPIILAPPSN